MPATNVSIIKKLSVDPDLKQAASENKVMPKPSFKAEDFTSDDKILKQITKLYDFLGNFTKNEAAAYNRAIEDIGSYHAKLARAQPCVMDESVSQKDKEKAVKDAVLIHQKLPVILQSYEKAYAALLLCEENCTEAYLEFNKCMPPTKSSEILEMCPKLPVILQTLRNFVKTAKTDHLTTESNAKQSSVKFASFLAAIKQIFANRSANNKEDNGNKKTAPSDDKKVLTASAGKTSPAMFTPAPVTKPVSHAAMANAQPPASTPSNGQ